MGIDYAASREKIKEEYGKGFDFASNQLIDAIGQVEKEIPGGKSNPAYQALVIERYNLLTKSKANTAEVRMVAHFISKNPGVLNKDEESLRKGELNNIREILMKNAERFNPEVTREVPIYYHGGTDFYNKSKEVVGHVKTGVGRFVGDLSGRVFGGNNGGFLGDIVGSLFGGVKDMIMGLPPVEKAVHYIADQIITGGNSKNREELNLARAAQASSSGMKGNYGMKVSENEAISYDFTYAMDEQQVAMDARRREGLAVRTQPATAPNANAATKPDSNTVVPVLSGNEPQPNPVEPSTGIPTLPLVSNAVNIPNGTLPASQFTPPVPTVEQARGMQPLARGAVAGP